MKTTEVPPGAATATINAQIRSLQACIKELSEEFKALEAKTEALEAEIEAQEKSQAQEAEKNATKMKDLENQIENPKNEEDDIDPEVTSMQDAIIDALEELFPYDKYGPGGEIEKELDAWREHVESQKDVDINDPEFSLMPPRPRNPSLFPEEMFRRG